MKDKILALLKSEGLKSSQLAERLELNPAAISHILSGRNKPGFELLQKILRKFPQIDPDWLLLDAPRMYRTTPGQLSEDPKMDNDLFTGSPSLRSTDAPTPAASAKPAERPIPGQPIKNAGKIDRIIIFYTDQTCEEFTIRDACEA